MNQERIFYLIKRYADQTISAEEKVELMGVLADVENAELQEAVSNSFLQEGWPSFDIKDEEAGIQEQIKAILSVDKRTARSPELTIPSEEVSTGTASTTGPEAMPVHRVQFLRKGFFRYAAAILIILGAGTVIVMSITDKGKEKPMLASQQEAADIKAGGNKAMLTLSDGSTITLDDAANGSIARQGNASIVKLANGQVVYNLKGNADGEVMMNTMSTPRGGQYQLTLPDGTKVWLNAASSITYPAAFVEKQRKVRMTGEVYFEVSTSRAKPFIVDVAGKTSIEVLGTRFNVNSYADEANIKATLAEGSVKVSTPAATSVTPQNAIILKPGEQAIITERTGVSLNNHADIEQALAWKNGTFNFQDMSFPEAARQLERWYDIQVVYEGQIPEIQFKGDMDRGVNLSDILRLFTAWGIKARIEDKKLIIQ